MSKASWQLVCITSTCRQARTRTRRRRRMTPEDWQFNDSELVSQTAEAHVSLVASPPVASQGRPQGHCTQETLISFTDPMRGTIKINDSTRTE
ncbi:GL13051 [Drosophila persimilis]|uniref:GL13051 n=1 Tax=Drosophila persimilis TaxID=7234 RepID=B4HDQ5_DROPE|nr:GL13051 [Drosophila persimilis]